MEKGGNGARRFPRQTGLLAKTPTAAIKKKRTWTIYLVKREREG
jgi:hypothetical protein